MGFLDGLKDEQIVQQCSQVGVRQDKGVCATLVCRWIKYKLVGKDFWANSHNTRASRWVERTTEIGVVKAHTDWGKTLASQQNRYLEITQNSTDKAGPFSPAHEIAKRLTGQSDTWARSPTSFKEVRKLSKLREAGITHVSATKMPMVIFANNAPQLRSVVESLAEGETAFLGLEGDNVKNGHALGLHWAHGKISMYDPNLAELCFSLDDFIVWWEKFFVPAWKGTPYESFSHGQISVSFVRGHQELGELSKDVIVEAVKAEAVDLFSDEIGFFPCNEDDDPFANSQEDDFETDFNWDESPNSSRTSQDLINNNNNDVDFK